MAVLAWTFLSGDPTQGGREVTPGPEGEMPAGPDASAGRPTSTPPAAPTAGAGRSTTAAPAGRTSGAIEPGLRPPSGEDLSDPVRVARLLREALAVAPADWARIGELLAILGEPLERDVLDALVRGVLDPASTARAAAAWSRIRDPKALDALLPRLTDAAPGTDAWKHVVSAVASAARVPGADRRGALAALRGVVGPSPHPDGPALEGIARIGGPDGLDVLVELATRPQGPVRLPPFALKAWDPGNDPEVGRRLARALSDPAVPPEALVALADLAVGGVAGAEAVPALLALDQEGQDPRVVGAAFDALSRVGDDRAWERLLGAAQAAGERAQAARVAIAYSATSATPDARARLVLAAQSTADDELRSFLVRGLGRLREPSALPLLTAWVDSGTDPVRRESIAALGSYGARAGDAVEALGRAYGAGDEGQRSLVAASLSSIGTLQARRLLEQARASETSPHVRQAVDAAIRRLEAGPARSP